MIVKVRTLEQLQVALNYNLEVLYITDLSLLSYIKDKNIDVYYVEPRAGIEREKYPINVVASRLGRYLDFVPQFIWIPQMHLLLIYLKI